MDAIILAAGEGTRLRPLTSTRPKPMLPVAGKSILEWNLEALSANDIKRVLVVVGYKKEKIIDHFGDKFGGMKLEYITQTEQMGTGHAIQITEKKMHGDFLVTNGDILISPGFIQKFIRDFEKHKSHTIGLIEVENPEDFGVVTLKDGSDCVVENIIEKPEKPKSNLANAGIYIFTEGIFDAIRQIKKSERLEYEITDAIKILIPEGIYGAICREMWLDIGRPWDLLDANELIMKRSEPSMGEGTKIEDYAVIKGNVHIGKNTLVRSGSYIEGPCHIGDNCTIGPNCYIRSNSTVMDNCHIGNAVEVKNSIIMQNTNIGHLSYVGDSIIAENCNFGAGTKVANLKFGDDPVKVEIKKKIVSSGRRKLGCIMGDGVKTGINVSIMPGRSIYPGVYIEAGSVVRNTIYSE